MSTLLKPFQVRKELLNRRVKIFSRQDFRRIFGVSADRAKYFLEKEAGDGILLRLKRGLYCLSTDVPAEEEIANRLYQPSYVSFEYALASFNILPEMPYVVTSATTKPTRNFEVTGTEFVYFKIKRQAYTGYKLVKDKEKSFLMAGPEKAVVDYLYFVALGKKSKNERLEMKSLNKKKMFEYGKLFGRKKLMDQIGEIK